MDKQRFAEALGALSLTTGGSKLEPETLRAYYAMLSDYTIEQVERAARVLSTQPGRTFFPSAGEFTEVMNTSVSTEAEKKWQRLGEAIGKLDSKGERIGRDNPPEATGATAYALRSIGGFAQFCNAPEDHHSRQWMRKQFIEAFEGYTQDALTHDVNQGIEHKPSDRLTQELKHIEFGQ